MNSSIIQKLHCFFILFAIDRNIRIQFDNVLFQTLVALFNIGNL